MTRRLDSEVTKAKRQVVRMYGQLQSVLNQISMYIDYEYKPDLWDKLIPTLDEEQQEIHQVTRKRHDIASNIVSLKAKKSQLRHLVSSNNATKSQTQQFKDIKKKVAEAISNMSAQPELGSTYAEYEALPETFKRKSIGHPRVTLQELYVSTTAELNMVLTNLHNAEKAEFELNGDESSEFKQSTIESILEESDKISVNAGRKSLDGPVAEIEALERKKRNVLKLIEEIEAEEEPTESEASARRGRKKLPKAERIEDKAILLSEIQYQISDIESTLMPLELANRHKRVLEREKRYAKQDGHRGVVTAITKKLKSIEKAIEDSESKKITDKELLRRINNAKTGVSITVDETVEKLVSTALIESSQSLSNSNSDSNPDEDILDTMQNMVLPEF